MELPTRQLSRRNSLIGSTGSGDRRVPSLNNVSSLSPLDESLPLPDHLAQKFSETQTSTLQRIFRCFHREISIEKFSLLIYISCLLRDTCDKVTARKAFFFSCIESPPTPLLCN